MTRLFSLGERDHGSGTDEWYTPKWLFDALGLTFDLDVCAPVTRDLVSVPAARFLTENEDGLAQPWSGLVWCNPPYSDASRWVDRMIDHRCGLMLVHQPVNAEWARRFWDAVDAIRLFGGMYFVRSDGSRQRLNYSIQLGAFGPVAVNALVGMAARLPPTLEQRWTPGPAWQRVTATG